jgi:REP element-mobilizing transposase RayT
MGRGLERRVLFEDGQDYLQFRKYLGDTLITAGSKALAWALMPNHYHLVLRSGPEKVSKVMQVLLTSYGHYFNRKRRRVGYVYQGRFKSVLCEEETYLLELVRYVHLNPVRARIVRSLRALAGWPWAGHGAILGKEKIPWQDVEGVLGRFGKGRAESKRRYVAFLNDGLKQGNPGPGLGGVSLIRALGGVWGAGEGEPPEAPQRVGDERILGDEGFIQKALDLAEEREDRRDALARAGWTDARVIQRAAKVAGTQPRFLRGGSKVPEHGRGRALACKWLVEDLGKTTVEVGRKLRIDQSTVVKACRRGRELELELRVRLEEGKTGRQKARKS